jgi:Lipopolysaccharide kinase (Kdo/WaaP) family
MATPDQTQDFVVDRLPWARVHRRTDTPLDSVLELLSAPSQTMKTSRKSVTRRVGDLVVKASRFEGGLGVLKHTVLRSRYRQAWRAALHLSQHGVGVATPIAFVEYGRFGIITGNVFVSEFLEGCCDIETFADRMEEQQASNADVHAYLEGLADAVDRLCASGAHHTDLAGKNILTRDGQSFYFVDLDGIELDGDYGKEARFKNHVQLYDSLCDWWDDSFLLPFLQRMLPEDASADAWTASVRDAHARRRAAIEAKWRRQGVVSKHTLRRQIRPPSE